MDNPISSYSPKPALVVVGWLGAAAAASGSAYLALVADRTGALLFGVAAVALAAAAAHGALVRPRLAADHDGIRVRTLTSTRQWSWPEVRVRSTTTRRLGRDVSVLEIEADELLILGALELGADPRDVLDELNALRPAY
ncbi:PH domain-containing protein [Amycolatopsis marina]|uniref:PH domain-containing protein n=1 Tax=Amycolatopsis marina TaxID=490629 RepID=A0A1I0W1R9_9PSEU|nr:PH domain-containing protein [Amycolatopsis marina]SFA81866.1 PH domain-containing protein [Amycolatopsis marina]